MHEIQQHVIHQLILRNGCRYRDIKPKDVEGNLFMYHLRLLTQNGLVTKEGSLYFLTKEGLHLADGLSLQSLTPRIQPKIVTLLAVQNKTGDWLLYKRSRQPFYGLIGFPYGKIHLGETIKQAAERELLEKTGLSAELTHRGDAYITVYDQEAVISQMLCHVFVGQNSMGDLIENSSIGECFWAEIDLEKTNCSPGFKEIYGLIQQKTDRFFEEIVIKS